MFSSLFTVVSAALVLGVAANPIVERQSGETHTVTLVNNCPSGSVPQFLYEADGTPQGSATISGPLKGGVAWVSNYPGANCGSSGVNCDIVEFTLINSGDDSGNTQNAVDYSLQGAGTSAQGNHNYVYPMNVEVSGCTLAPAGLGPCTGPTPDVCPGVFTGSDAEDGTVYQCTADNVGITITFC